MPRDSKSDAETPLSYRRYRVPDPTVAESPVDTATAAADDGTGTCDVLLVIALALVSIAFYITMIVVIIGLVAWVLASMLGLIG